MSTLGIHIDANEQRSVHDLLINGAQLLSALAEQVPSPPKPFSVNWNNPQAILLLASLRAGIGSLDPSQRVVIGQLIDQIANLIGDGGGGGGEPVIISQP